MKVYDPVSSLLDPKGALSAKCQSISEESSLPHDHSTVSIVTLIAERGNFLLGNRTCWLSTVFLWSSQYYPQIMWVGFILLPFLLR
jgi:hypothetical protein